MAPAATVDWLLGMLHRQHGSLAARPKLPPLSELVLTVLSQNTSDVNSHRAFDNLISRFTHWQELLHADESEIAGAIKVGGLGNIKAPRIKAILAEILKRTGDFDLGFLARLPMEKAMDWLESLPGVGPKTAACVLLFSLDMPALPVDTHVLRVSQRLGLVARPVTAEKAQQRLQDMLRPAEVYSFHVYLIAHGRTICTARQPRCGPCLLNARCPSGFTFGKQRQP